MSGAMAAVIAEGEEVMKWKRGSHAMRRQPFPHGRVHGTRRRKHATAGFVTCTPHWGAVHLVESLIKVVCM